MKNKDIQNELEELSPLLAQLKKEQQKENAMPANYFSSFEDRLMHRIQEEEALQPKAILSNKENKNWLASLFALFQTRVVSGLALGAVVGLGIYMVVHFYNQNGLESEATASTLLAELSIEETEVYLMNNIEEDIALLEIVELLEEEELVQMQEESEEALELKEATTPTKIPSTATENISTINKALKETNNDNLLDEITEEDLESYELF